MDAKAIYKLLVLVLVFEQPDLELSCGVKSQEAQSVVLAVFPSPIIPIRVKLRMARVLIACAATVPVLMVMIKSPSISAKLLLCANRTEVVLLI